MAENAGSKRDPSEQEPIPLENAANDPAPLLRPVTPASGVTLLYTLAGHTDNVIYVAWSPDGKWLAAGSHDGAVRVWDPSTGKQVHTLVGHTKYLRSVIWSPDGKWLASQPDEPGKEEP